MNIKKKLERLLALAKCKTGNKNETLAAAARLAKLLEKHNLTEADLEASNDEEINVNLKVVVRMSRMPDWKVNLMSGICTALRAKFIACMGAGLGIIGTDTQAESASYLYSVYVKEVDRLVKTWKKQQGWRIHTLEQWEVNAFRKGVSVGIQEKFTEARADADRRNAALLRKRKKDKGLMRLDQLAVKIQKTLDSMKTGKRSNSRPKDYGAFQAGKRSGRGVGVSVSGDGRAIGEGQRRLKA